MATARVCPSCATPLPGEAAFCFMCGAATPQGIDKLTGEIRAASGAERAPAQDLDRLKRALSEHYELGRLLGRGGFAEVYLLHDRRLKRDLALKALRPELTFSPGLLTRFRREAETVAALRHPHIVPIYDIGEAEGVMYIIMPLIQGESLTSLLMREGPRPPREALRILLEAADALGAAHDAGVVHRDVKPENIMLEGKGRRVQLMDFGIAKALDANEGAGLTSTGILVGTPHYMSPEQASGELNLDHRSDQYSLAVVGYQMVTGEMPFDGESTRAILFQQMVGVPKNLRDLVPDVPPNLAFPVERALSKERGDRYPSMEAFAEALAGPDSWTLAATTDPRISQALGPGAAMAAAGPTVETPKPVRPRRRKWVPLAAALGTVVAASALAAAFLRPGTSIQGRSVDSVRPAGDSSQPSIGTTEQVVLAPNPVPGEPGRSVERPAPGQTDATTAARPPAARPPTPTPTCASATRAEDWDEAAARCRSEADRGSPTAIRLLASLYQEGRGVERSDSAAMTLYRAAVEAGDARSAYQLALMLAARPGDPSRESEATRLLRQAADAGIPEAWPVLAERYEQGLGVRRNDQEAAFWYRKAAEQGNRGSQYNLGVMYARGRGVSKSEPEAARWWERAADQAHAAAQYELGMAYLRGRGVEKSDSLGVAWLERAAAQGHPEAVKEAEKRSRP